jgi:hypothetical protein
MLTAFFSYICGQGHCLVIDNEALPVCIRCFGLYLGAALTGVWLLTSGLWRRGLPSCSVFAIHVVCLLTAMLGGMHILGGGPIWRLLCGLWTGWVLTMWLVGAGKQLWLLSRGPEAQQRPWRRSDKTQALVAGPALAMIACAIQVLPHSGRHLWTGAVVTGAVLLLAAIVFAVSGMAAWLVSECRARLGEMTCSGKGGLRDG